MRKNKLTVLLLVLLIACLCMSLIACDNTKDSYIPGKTTIEAVEDGIPDVDYEITVLYPDRKPVVGVEVQLFLVDDDEEPFCGATTSSDGIATLHTSKGLEYFIVINNLPAGYIYDSEDLVLESETTKTVYIESELVANKYNIYVVSEGGMPMKNLTVSLKDGDEILASKVTGEDGIAAIKVPTLGEYAIELVGLPTGYTIVNPDEKTTANGGQVTITVKSEVIKSTMPANHTYKMDDIMYDFSVTTSDGTTFTLSEVLKEKKFVMINFWATWCTYCKAEFEDIEYAYEKYQDDMAVIALSKYNPDDLATIANFKASYSPTLTFDMGRDENETLYNKFAANLGVTGIPLSIFVDRYGKICDYVYGAGTESLFTQEFDRYTSDDYVQKAYDPNNSEIPVDEPDKPDVNMPESSEIVNKISPELGGTYSEENDGIIWPWILDKDNNSDILKAGNLGRNNTSAILYYTFKIGEGQFLTFDYFMNTEDIGNADIMSVYIDGDWVCELERVSETWKTKYLYTPINAEDAQKEHTLMLYYTKDASDGVYLKGDELVAIKNMRVVTQSELQGDVNILRPASWNFDKVDGVNQYTSFITPVFNETDGYYHVGSVDGPILLANLGSATHYNQNSVSVLAEGGVFELAGIPALTAFITDGISNPPADSYVEYHKGYAWIAKNSSLPNYCYVDKRLAIVLDAMVEAFVNTKYNGEALATYYNENTWLELCYYVDNYHGEGIGNIMEGICDREAIEAVGDNQANHVVVDRTLVPRGIIHKYTATKTGAYKIYSIIPDEYASQQGGYVHIEHNGSIVKSEDATDNFEQYVTFRAGETYYIGVAFDLPGSWGELDFYIEYIDVKYDYFTTVTDGTYTYEVDVNGNPIYDANGQYIYIVNKYDMDLGVKLDDDGYYRQYKDGAIDESENPYIWIALSQENVLLNATLKELANGTASIEDLDVGFFDFSNEEEGEDYSEYILKLCEEAEKKNPNEDLTWGMLKADEKLVSILKKALARIDHDSDDSWLGVAFYHEHLGE